MLIWKREFGKSLPSVSKTQQIKILFGVFGPSERERPIIREIICVIAPWGGRAAIQRLLFEYSIYSNRTTEWIFSLKTLVRCLGKHCHASHPSPTPLHAPPRPRPPCHPRRCGSSTGQRCTCCDVLWSNGKIIDRVFCNNFLCRTWWCDKLFSWLFQFMTSQNWH